MSTAETSTNPLPAPEKKPGVRHIIDNAKYPDYIKTHAVFAKLDKITKVFPGIGLPNSKEDCEYSNINDARTDAQNLLYTDMRTALYNTLSTYGMDTPIRVLLSAVYNHIGTYYMAMVLEEEGKLAIKFNADVGVWDTKVFARKGESAFKVYNKLIEKCKETPPTTPLVALETLTYFKSFSATNISSGKKYQVCFSSSGQDGAWDIATISMRGIASCQAWNTPQSRGLIGSIASKYVGVLYITNGEPFNEYGSKMLRRAMTRFAIHKTTKKPALLVDRTYPADEANVRSIFKKFLQSKVNIPILFTGELGWADYCLPVDSYSTVTPLAPGENTYMDNKIPWKNALQPKDLQTYYQRVAHLDQELSTKVHNSLIKKLDEYCLDKKTNREEFKGGVANLILAMKKHLGGGTFLGHFLPKLYNYCGTSLPKADQFDAPKAYEKAVIKHVFVNMKTFDATANRTCMQMGKFIKFFPTSSNRLVTLAMSEYKKELVARYKDLIQN